MFLLLIPCSIILSLILLVSVINLIEYIFNRYLNKEIEITSEKYVGMLFIICIILQFIIYNYFISLDFNPYQIN